jgi:hypothetical protein
MTGYQGEMTMIKKLMLVVVALTLVSSPAFAKAARHCVDKDKKVISVTGAPGKSAAAACKAAGGKWVKVKTAKAK